MSNSPTEILTHRIPQFRIFAAHHSKENHDAKRELSRSFGYFTSHPFARLNQKRLKAILERIETLAPRPSRVLDLACGAGIITHCVSDLGHRAVGLDADPREIHWAKLFGQEHRAAGQFLKGDASRLTENFSDIENTLGGRPQIILLAYALHHLPEVEKTLDALLNWIPEDAVILINEENPRSPLFRAKHWLRTKIQKDTDQEWHRTTAQWNQLFGARGWLAWGEPKGIDLLGEVFEEKWSQLWTLKKNGTLLSSGLVHP